ncbi:MAG: hypothetical protein K8T10_06730 [Candidatus Eremiobacteraeota bacterium]|nr:hypothetical protein [Candidatus Eremiobacteraeota bacterium]
MHLTINEIVYLLHTWNGWYLVAHDENLHSDYSDNHVRVNISPYDNSTIHDDVADDLEAYTDDVDFDDPDNFKIGFLFAAAEHQTNEIFNSLRPVIAGGEGADIEIINTMKFVEEDLPPEAEIEESLDPKTKDALKKYRARMKEKEQEDEEEDEAGEEKAGDEEEIKADLMIDGGEAEHDEAEEEDRDEDEDEDKISEIELPENELIIRGTITREFIDVKEILHNGEVFPDLEIFLEAARLYETVARNFQEPESKKEMGTYECADDSEAAVVSLFVSTMSEHGSCKVDKKTIRTNTTAEELATVISYIRYREKMKMFKNPLVNRLRAKKNMQKNMMRKMSLKFCSCMFYALAIVLLIVFYFYWIKKK